MSGYDFTDRYHWIVEAARKIRRTSFAIDGEAVVLGVDGVSDILTEDGKDLRELPLHLRKDR